MHGPISRISPQAEHSTRHANVNSGVREHLENVAVHAASKTLESYSTFLIGPVDPVVNSPL